MKGLIDSTLREGEQTPGVYFSHDDRIRIADLLLRTGIEEIELGIVTAGNQELKRLITQVRSRRDNSGQTTRLALWCRCREADLSFAAKLQPDVLSLSLPVSDLHIRKKCARSRKWVLKRATISIGRALEAGIPYVSLGLEDAGRADPDFIAQVVETAGRAKAHRIRFADTVGLLTPMEICSHMKNLKEITDLEIGLHAHNDFGMATANTISALQQGADWADVTVLGLGERAGNARLEEVAGFLSLRKNPSRYRTEHFRHLCRTVAEAADMIIDPGHPVVGSAIFTCETGLHLQGLFKDPSTYEPYSPDLVNADRALLLGSKSGCNAVRAHCRALGCDLSGLEAENLTRKIRKLAAEKKRPLGNEEIRQLVG